MLKILRKIAERIHHAYWLVFVFGPENRKIAAKIKRQNEQYKRLKKTELPDIPDDELEAAVRIWFRNKINEDWSNQYEAVTALPKPCQNVYSTMIVTDEVMNGGFYQLFFNPSRQFVEMSVEGYLALESTKLSGLVKQAAELYQQNKQIIESRYNAIRNGTRNSFYTKDDPDEPNESFSELNEAFFEYDTIDYTKYIRQNAECFGDE